MPDTGEGRSALPDNRIREYGGIRYFYDGLGNLIHSDDGGNRILRDFEYDLYDRLVKTEVRRRNPGTGEWDKANAMSSAWLQGTNKRWRRGLWPNWAELDLKAGFENPAIRSGWHPLRRAGPCRA